MVAEDITAISGGVPAVVKQLSERLTTESWKVTVISAIGSKDDISAPVTVDVYPPGQTILTKTWKWNSSLKDKIIDLANLKNNHIFHIHGIWSAPQYFAAKIAHNKSLPFILSAHGMLEPWLWRQQGPLVKIKKQIYWNIFAKPAFNKSTIIHAITPIERDNLKTLFKGGDIEIIPNAIDIASTPIRINDRKKVVLFLGRIEPKKGVDILLRAFAASSLKKDWIVKIAGPIWSSTYMSLLKSICSENNIEKQVIFLGPVFGEDKFKLLNEAWVMATPSHSEAIGLVNLEAAKHLLPTITTHQTGLYDWQEGGGILTNPTIESIKIALENSKSWSESEQAERGLSSFELVKNKYSWNAVLPKWIDLYNSIQ